MDNTDKVLLICMIGMIIGFILITIDVRNSSYAEGLSEGWARGRAADRQEFHKE